MILRFIISSLIIVSFTNALATDPTELKIAIERLLTQKTIINKIERNIERIDKARFLVLKRSVDQVLTSIDQYGLSNLRTINRYQELIVKFRYSAGFLNLIQNEGNANDILRLAQITEEIRKARGFDDTPYTKVTANTYRQMYQLIKSLHDNDDISDELRIALENQIAPIGRLISIADQAGDRPQTFEEGIKIYHSIAALYPLLNQVANTEASYETVLEIQGLNEFYGEYAQVLITEADSNY